MCVDFSFMFMFLSNHRATSVVVFSHLCVTGVTLSNVCFLLL